MTLWLLSGLGIALLGSLGFFLWRGERAGRNAERADHAKKALEAINEAIKARDDTRLDTDKRERLRDRYRKP